jgi:hypothetical protein
MYVSAPAGTPVQIPWSIQDSPPSERGGRCGAAAPRTPRCPAAKAAATSAAWAARAAPQIATGSQRFPVGAAPGAAAAAAGLLLLLLRPLLGQRRPDLHSTAQRSTAQLRRNVFLALLPSLECPCLSVRLGTTRLRLLPGAGKWEIGNGRAGAGWPLAGAASDFPRLGGT